MKFLLAFILAFTGLTTTAHAQATDDYFKIKKVKRKVIVNDDVYFTDRTINDLNFIQDTVTQQTPTAGSSDLDIMDTLFKIWQVVKDNKPVVTVNSQKFATALPEIAKTDWAKVSGWMTERNITVKNDYVNLYGMNVISLHYQVKLLYGGNVGGKGLYIAFAKVVPIKVDVAWGYTLNVDTDVPAVVNARTPENPLAVIHLNINYRISTIVKDESVSDSYQVQGDGLIKNTKTNRVLAQAMLK